MARLPICLFVVSLASTAHAQHARYPRQQPAPPQVTLSPRVQPAAAPATVGPVMPAVPALTADAVLSIEGLRGAIRGEQEQILAELINNTADSEVEEKSDYYFRLGELYSKQQRHWRLRATEQGTSQQEQRRAAELAKTYLLKAVKTYKGLTDNDAFRNYPRMDLALFYYGYTLQSGKYMKEARAVYDKLLKSYPNSKYVPEAHLAFADYYFEAGQLADAEARYKMVLKFPKSAAYWYAMYKVGSIHLALARHQEALETFFQVAQATRNDKDKALLHRSARQEFVRAYAEIGKADKAMVAFKRVDTVGAFEMTQLLANLYIATKKHDKAVYLLRELIASNPNHRDACTWQYHAAQMMLALPGASTADKVAEIKALTRVFAAQQNPDAECRANTEAMAGELAGAYHSEWSKTQNVETLGYAEQLYAAHITAFPTDSARRLAHAEVLWTRADREANARTRAERWTVAANAFAALQTTDGARAAVLAWMNALDLALPAAQVAIGKAPRQVPKAQPLTDREQKLVAALEAYVQAGAAVDADLAQMRLAVAAMLRSKRQFDQAAGVLDVFLANHASDARAELAANLLLDSMIQGRMLDEVLQVADAMAADHAFVANKPELQKNLHILRTRSIR